MSNRVDGQPGGGTERTTTSETRRDFVKKAAYVAPLILTVTATPTLARTGSRYDNHYSENKDYSSYWSQFSQYFSRWFD